MDHTTKQSGNEKNESIVHFASGEYLFYEGEPSDFAYEVVEGTLALMKDSQSGPVVLCKVRKGELVGEMGIIDGSPRSASAIAESDVVVRRIDVPQFMSRLEKDGQFSIELINRLIGNVREANEKLAQQSFMQESDSRTNGDSKRHGKGLVTRDGPLRFFAKDHDYSEFQADAAEIEQRHFPTVAKVTLYVIIAFFGLTLTWASLSEIETAIVAPGKITTTVPNITVQPVETAMVLSIDAKEGDLVEKGQRLARLDATFAQADLQASKATYTSVLAEERRLVAELDGTPIDHFSDNPAIQRLQAEIYSRRSAEHDAKLEAHDERIAQLEVDIATNVQDAKDMAEQVEVLTKLENMHASLIDVGGSSEVQYLHAKNGRLSLEREQRRLMSERRSLQHRLGATKTEKLVYESERRSTIAKELVAVSREREELEERLKKMERRETLVDITAPARGIVLEIADRSVGSVVPQAETFFTIVPVDVPLQMEASVAPKDVGQIKIGDTVKIKLDALPFQKHGSADGVVGIISEDTVSGEDEGRQPAYKTKIELSGTKFRNTPEDFRLLPGMTGTAEIKVGKRRVITYFLYPIARAMENSFREP